MLADLHVHLLGAITSRIAADVMGRRDCFAWPPMLIAHSVRQRQAAFFRHFRQLAPIYTRPAVLAEAARRVAYRFAAQGVRCAELRFSPVWYVEAGLDPMEPLLAISQALRAVECARPIVLGLVASIPQHRSRYLSVLTSLCLEAFAGGVIQGVDFHGRDDAGDDALLKRAWSSVGARGVPFTVHCGEFGSLNAIARAIDSGAWRLGHGLALGNHRTATAQVVRSGAVLEVCLSSSRYLQDVEPQYHPLRGWIEDGVRWVLGTDDPALFRTTMARETAIARRSCRLDEGRLIQLAQTSVSSAMVTQDGRRRLQTWLAASQ